jgi:hypothetical protein
MRDDYVKVENEDGEMIDFLPDRQWLYDDPRSIAEDVAQGEMDDAGGDLADPSDWPRTYTVHLDSGPVVVSVDMEYSPVFMSKIKTESEDENETH